METAYHIPVRSDDPLVERPKGHPRGHDCERCQYVREYERLRVRPPNRRRKKTSEPVVMPIAVPKSGTVYLRDLGDDGWPVHTFTRKEIMKARQLV